jgi:thiamine-monophosphate kinase
VLAPEPGFDLVATQDALVEDVHFRRRWTAPGDLAYKLLAVSVSDIAAMAAVPRFALVALALPVDLDAAWSEAFARGLRRAGQAFGLTVVGGDTVRSSAGIMADGVVLGQVPHGRAVPRSRARPGDVLYVTGRVGGAAVGLRLFEAPALAAAMPASVAASARRALLRPRPRVAEGQALQAHARALVDLSDGLGGAVEALTRGRSIGVEIRADAVPLHPAAVALARHLGVDPLDLALAGGEDYELLAALPRRTPVPTALAPSLWPIGVVRAGPGAWLIAPSGERRPLPAGYDAFGPGAPRRPSRTTT